MTNEYASLRNLKFLLSEVLEVDKLSAYPFFAAYDQEAIDLTLDAAKQTADRYLYPYYRIMDKEKAVFQDGEVKVHPAMGPGIRAIAEGGWISAAHAFEAGGQQMPHTLLNASLFLFYAANANMAAHPFLSAGAANLLQSFASDSLKQTYLPKLYSGNWQGTMALTEPQAGSSLSDITTSATPTDTGVYQISGQKIYISGGDHNAVDNVVHLLLARIKGAPAGTKGISLFVVPKFRPEGNALVDNHVTTAGIYGKMGQKGYVAAHLMFGEQGETLGYLVGEPHKGLSYMFQMMNEARIGTGLMAIGTASAAYYASLKYANERQQGRHPSNKDATQPPVLIIEHADVRRMLLFQKSIVEGSISLLLQCSYYADIARVGAPEVAEEAELLLELLTPIAKSFPSEQGTQAVSQGMQVLGGAGYTDDFPLEQLYRDIRVNAIYEGTTGIHGMDLLGRKIFMSEGKGMKALMRTIRNLVDEASQVEALQPYASMLAQRTAALHQTTLDLIQRATQHHAEVFLADATLYLENFSLVTIAWQWLKQGIVAHKGRLSAGQGPEFEFYQGKWSAMVYFFEYELPKTIALETRLKSKTPITLDTLPSFIN